ncbi:hypothetical protein RQP46_007484 [Phenoliferia psychrophenolica]
MTSQDRIPTADAQTASTTYYDFAIIGCGALGAVLAHTLAQSGRTVVSFDRDFSEPDRLIGELLQPGGCNSLKTLGMSDCLEGIDAMPMEGYKIFAGGREVDIQYPDSSRGWCFKYGRFIQSLRRKAQVTKNVTLIEATVNELVIEARGPQEKCVVGVEVTPRSESQDVKPIRFHAAITLVVDGCHSKFRRDILPKDVYPVVRSNFVGLLLEDADLPAPHHGHVILGGSSSPSKTASSEEDDDASSPIGPILVYQISPHKTRMLVDITGPRVPSASTGELASFLSTHVAPVLPPSLLPSFDAALDASSNPADRSRRLQVMPNQYLPPTPQGRGPEGAVLVGDSLNMRHPLTGGGMTVAFNDAVILTKLLGGGKKVGEVQLPEKVTDVAEWAKVCELLEEWHWERKSVSVSTNTLSLALYSIFAAEDENLKGLQNGCIRYFDLGGSAVSGPVQLLSIINTSPLLLLRHFFQVALYSVWCLFTGPQDSNHKRPSVLQYPALCARSVAMLWTACVVILPVLWNEA